MKYNLSKIRAKTAYSLQEVSALMGVNRRTLLCWLKEGLLLLDQSQTPKLVMGSDLKAFLTAKREAKQVKLNWDEFYCLSCRKAVRAKRGTQRTEKTGKTIGADDRLQEMLYAKCQLCDASIARFF